MFIFSLAAGSTGTTRTSLAPAGQRGRSWAFPGAHAAMPMPSQSTPSQAREGDEKAWLTLAAHQRAP